MTHAGVPGMEGVVADVRYGLRSFRRSKVFTAAAVLTLTVGIGLNTIVFTVADTVLHRGFPLVERNDRLVYVTSGVGCCVSVPDFDDWRSQARSFSAMALVRGLPKTLTLGGGYPERIDITEVTAGTFALVGQRPVLGRDFTEADERPGAEPVAILRYGAWERRFGKDPSIVGRVIRLDGTPTTIVGVMPPGFSFPQNQELWVPLARTPDVARRDNRNTWFVVGRLRDDVPLQGARVEMASIGRRLGAAYPLTNQGRNLVPYVEDFEGFFIGRRAATTYRSMIVAVALVLLIACANLANLLLARTLDRARELSVRMAIGAGRARIIRQMLTESLMIAMLGAIGGWVLARWGVRTYVLLAAGAGISDQAFGGTWFDDVLEYAIDYRAFAFLSVVSVLSAVLFGLAPALRAARVDLTRALNEGGRSGAHGRTQRFTHVLVAGQVALALVLLGGAAGMVQGLVAAMRPSSTFRTENVVAARVELPVTRYGDASSRIRFQDELRAHVAAMSGVQRVTLSSTLPASLFGGRVEFTADGGTSAGAITERPASLVQTVSDGYFSTLNLALVAGRDFDSRDHAEGAPVAIVSRTLADQQWRGDAVGKRLRLFRGGRAGEPLRVIGVAPDMSGSREQSPEPVVYLPQSQAPSSSMWLLMQASRDSLSVAPMLREALTRVDASLPIVDGPVPLAERLARAYRYRAVMAGLFAIFAIIALLLACMGLFAVVAQVVRNRTREIGVRNALGASAWQILQLVLTDGLRSVGVGAAIGMVVWLSFGHLIGRTVQEWSPGPADVVIAAGILALAAIIGCVIPARRALSIDPGQALRPE